MKSKLANIAGVVNVRLSELFDRTFDRMEASDKAELFFPIPPLRITQEVKSLTMRGGKRLRAALMTAGYELYAPDALQDDALLDCACALELLQTYFLIHDDIMDNDAERRGGPSVHTSLAAAYNSVEAGRSQAILAGDLANALHEYILARLTCKGQVKTTVQRIFSRMHMDVVFGQSLDLQGNAEPTEIVQRKTASYTTLGPMCIGAALAGAKDDELRTLADLATPLGIAFQYRDDYLGVFQNSDALGKPMGSDVKNNKRTHLIEDALHTANESQRQALEIALGNGTASEAQLDAAVYAITQCGAKERCEAEIEGLSRRAFTQLTTLTARDTGKPFVEWLIRRLADRAF